MSIQAGRKVVPTELGITLVRGYQLIDPELCLPQVRPLRTLLPVQEADLSPAWCGTTLEYQQCGS